MLWSRGVDTEGFRPRDVRLFGDGPVFLYVGRIAVEKNIKAFLDLDLPGKKARRRFGNLVLTRLPVGRVLRHLLPWPAAPEVMSMQRAAVEVVVEAPFGPLRVTTTHLEYYSKEHRAAHWTGTFSAFLDQIFPHDARGIARTSHQYIWDMMRAEGFDDSQGRFRCQLFEDELYGINDTIERVVDYFKAASAGSAPSRPSGSAMRPPLTRRPG